ncbi:hypothetical protein [Thiomicrorhabdus cannonii]|uniref:hypothetical protein n=1 Tax=Thiomicrorhabdus cannonii TaxID=2748011 RepID=UPI0015BE27B8|nr:hypothetical protein [Thiomicrorhabdus cannonii]
MNIKEMALYMLAGLVLLVSALVFLGSWRSGADETAMMTSLLHSSIILLGAGLVGWLLKVSAPVLLNGAALSIWLVIRPVVESIEQKTIVLLQPESPYLNDATEMLYQEPTWWMGDNFFYLVIGGVVVIFIAFFFRR